MEVQVWEDGRIRLKKGEDLEISEMGEVSNKVEDEKRRVTSNKFKRRLIQIMKIQIIIELESITIEI